MSRHNHKINIMKKIFFLTLLSLLCIFYNIQAQRFQATTGTPNPDEKWATVDDAATNRYVTIGNVTVANVAGGAVLQQLWISSYNKYYDKYF